MNWRRGLWRLWLIASLCWIVGIGGTAGTKWWSLHQIENQQQRCFDARKANTALGTPFDCFNSPNSSGHWVDETGNPVTDPNILEQLNAPDWGFYALAAFGVPFLILAVGTASYWVVIGFRRRST